QNVDRTKLLRRALNERRNIVAARNVRGNCERLDAVAAKRCGRVLELLTVPPADRDARAHLPEAVRDRETDSPARSGNDRDLPSEGTLRHGLSYCVAKSDIL